MQRADYCLWDYEEIEIKQGPAYFFLVTCTCMCFPSFQRIIYKKLSFVKGRTVQVPGLFRPIH